MEYIHLMHVPWTGLGLYGGFRGNRWLKNRIKVFKQFVVPSLQAQTNKNFVLWCAWRQEEKYNKHVRELMDYMNGIREFKTVHTFHGICFYDDKYEDTKAKERLIDSLHGSMGELFDVVGQVKYVLMTIQPSDDCYMKEMVNGIQGLLLSSDLDAAGFAKGYVMNYLTKEIAEYNPTTNPPFYTIKFPKDVFVDPLKHFNFTALKMDVGKYKAGTPCPSHEYIGDCMKYGKINERGFLVGCHLDNVSTFFDHPYKGESVDENTLEHFGLERVKKLVIPFSLGRIIFHKLPHSVKRKLRYLAGEKKWILRPFFALIYNLLRA